MLLWIDSLHQEDKGWTDMSTKLWIFNTGDGWLFPISNKNSMTFHKDVCARSATLTIVVITVTAGLVFTKHNQIPFCNPNQIPSVFFYLDL